VQPHPTQYRCKKANLPQIPGLTRTANGGHATVAVDCRDSRTSYPRRNQYDASGHRCARQQKKEGQPGVHWPGHQTVIHPSPTTWPGPASWHESESDGASGQEAHPAQGPSQVREVNSTSVERSTLGLPLCGAAVHASLAPAQPPPPAGLASDPACKENDFTLKKSRCRRINRW